ncbi:MAG TPA: AAA family ATPase [Patescibacteria group bacterium]|nr:AAA family ATPase [Patescibacteria group bacterium]
MKNNCIIAIVGMPGSGKSETIAYLQTKGIPCVRFGQITEDGLAKEGLEVTPENERRFREALREKHGMAAYALLSKPTIDALLKKNEMIAIDGLYSWEEYMVLQETYTNLILVALVVDASVRHERLGKRSVRALTSEEAKKRDRAEIENLNKAGPIARADYYIENNSDDKENLYRKIDEVLEKI